MLNRSLWWSVFAAVFPAVLVVIAATDLQAQTYVWKGQCSEDQVKNYTGPVPPTGCALNTDCMSIGTEAACDMADGCAWSMDMCMDDEGGTDCMSHATEMACDMADGCAWSMDMCMQEGDPCLPLGNMSACEAEGGCMWMSNHCMSTGTSCMAFDSQSDCTANGCVWSVDNMGMSMCMGGTADGSTDSPASGNYEIRYDSDAEWVSYDISWDSLVSPLTMIHTHGPATADQNAMGHLWPSERVFIDQSAVTAAGVDRETGSVSVALPLYDFFMGNPLPLEDSMSHMMGELGYINIHTDCYTTGELRCNLVLGDTIERQGKAATKCVGSYQKAAIKLAAAYDKAAASCLKATGSDDFAHQSMRACVEADAKGKITKARAKFGAAYAKACGQASPEFGLPSMDVAANAADAGLDLTASSVEGLFGDDLSGAVLPADKVVATCKKGVLKASHKCTKARLKSYNTCLKLGLRGGRVGLTIVDDSGVEGCFGYDPKGKVARTCAADGGKTASTIGKKCAGVVIGMAFPGSGASDSAGLAGVLEDATPGCYLQQITHGAMAAAESDECLGDEGEAPGCMSYDTEMACTMADCSWTMGMCM